MEPQENQPVTPEVVPQSETKQEKKTFISTPAAIITGAIIIALAIVFVLGPKVASKQGAQQQQPEPPKSVPKDVATLRTDDYVRGDKNAEVLAIEYSDSDCPFCQRFHPVLEQVLTDYNGKVAWVYRYFPLSIHPNAYTEAVALECVGELGGNDKFQNYLDGVVNVTLNPDPKSNQTLLDLAAKEGITQAKMKACIEGDAAAARVDKDEAEAQQIGAQGTPFTILVNQKTGKQAIIPGAYPIEDVKKAIDSLLK